MERMTGIEPALSAWESERSRPETPAHTRWTPRGRRRGGGGTTAQQRVRGSWSTDADCPGVQPARVERVLPRGAASAEVWSSPAGEPAVREVPASTDGA